MAIIAISRDLQDLRRRLGRITVGYSYDGRQPITAEDLGAAGAMSVLLKDAIKPNLIQTLEGQPCLMHCGPFANIAHGNSSLIGDRSGMNLGDYVVTESGFGSDMGMSKEELNEGAAAENVLLARAEAAPARRTAAPARDG